MQIHWIDWAIMIIPTLLVIGLAVYTKKYVRGVADFLAAGRVAGRYVLSVGELSSGLSVITLVGLVEAKYQTGFAVDFWANLMAPLSIIFALTGFCVYRWRETRALSFGQFLEMRYNRAFRIFASSLRTVSEMIANALSPAIAATFFVYFLGLPHHVTILGINLPCFAIMLVVLMTLAMICVWPGGRVSLLITDTFQGILSYPVFVIIVGYVIFTISWGSEMAPTLADRVPEENFLNPFDIDKLRDFNIFAICVSLIGGILNRASWFGNDASNCGRTPHEQKMAGILGAWRNGFSSLMFAVIAVFVITVMNHRNFATEAQEIRSAIAEKAVEETIHPTQRPAVMQAISAIGEQTHQIGVDAPLSQKDNLDTTVFSTVLDTLGDTPETRGELQQFRTKYQQQMMTIVVKKMFPIGMTGLFGLLMIMMVLSWDDSRLFNAASTFVQDVVLPLKKQAMSQKEHLLWLRLGSLGVAIFFLTFSLLFVQVDYINMFMAIVCAIWLGGAGPVMLFGLYSRFGNTTGAFASVITGSLISVSGMWGQQRWVEIIYPFLVRHGWVETAGNILGALSMPFEPYIIWKISPDKFPINSFEIYFLAMLFSLLAYSIGSYVTYKGPFNIDRLLHRGIYNVDGTIPPAPFQWSWKTVMDKLIGITEDYTRGDKIITWSVFWYSVVYQFLFAFLLVAIWNIFDAWPMAWWSYYFLITILIVPAIAGIVSTVWFMWGGIRDTIALCRDLEKRVNNPLDDGRVENGVSLADLAQIQAAEKRDS